MRMGSTADLRPPDTKLKAVCVLHFHLLWGQEGGLMLTHLGLAEDAL